MRPAILGMLNTGHVVSPSPVYGNDITGTSGQIASPLYPRTYPNNADYRWTITVPGDDYVQIHFLDMDIEDLYDCYYDQLKVCVVEATDSFEMTTSSFNRIQNIPQSHLRFDIRKC